MLGQLQGPLGHDVAETVRVVGDEPVDTGVHKGAHCGLVVDGPGGTLHVLGVRSFHHVRCQVRDVAGVGDLAVLRGSVDGRDGVEAERRSRVDEVPAEVIGVNAAKPG